MRVIRDAVGNITQDGQVLHTNVRYQVDDQRRVAVWADSRTKAAPVVVYEPNTVETTVTRKPCSCKGDQPRMTLMRMWDQHDRATV